MWLSHFLLNIRAFQAILIWGLFLSAFNTNLNALERKITAEMIMQEISPDDLSILEKFFRELLFFRELGYTLFGDKPISTEYFDLENPHKPDLYSISSVGYLTWEKYAPLFPQKNYLFLFYVDQDKEICELTLINKKAFHQIVNENSAKFTAFFGPQITSEKLLNLLIQKRSLWNTPMKDRDDLIGILLGYGKTNSELFQKRSEIWGKKLKLSKNRTKPSSGYLSVAEEQKALSDRLRPFSNEGRITLNYMRLPAFVADGNHQESIKLKKKYTEQRKNITQRYSHKNVLKVTFERLCSQET